MPQPTVDEALRFIRKLEQCSSDGAKLIVLKNFMARAVSPSLESRDRTPQDYAIEHAEYLAREKPEIQSLRMYYEQKDGCKLHGPCVGKICLDCVSAALREKEAELALSESARMELRLEIVEAIRVRQLAEAELAIARAELETEDY